MTYDSRSNRVILFGGWGCGSECYLDDTWAFDPVNTTWTNLRPSVHPPARVGAAMSYDASLDRVILFGGNVLTQYATRLDGRTWFYDYANNTWTDANPTRSPPPRVGSQMTYDSADGRTVLFGGYVGPPQNETNETWTYDARANLWTNVTGNIRPSSAGALGSSFGIVYDSSAGRVILLGMSGTWDFDPSLYVWSNRNASTAPLYYGFAMAYDAAAARTVVLGSSDASSTSFTWLYEYASNTWTNVTQGVSPSHRYYHTMAYASQAGLVISFGGSGSETWAYDAASNRWTNLQPTGRPSPRVYSAAAFNTAWNRLILFGGYLEAPPYENNETWAYDPTNNTWANLHPAAHPSARYLSAMAYDPLVDRVLLVGGAAGTTGLSDVWAYDYRNNTWTNRNPAYRPGPIVGHSLIYDVAVDRFVLFGGAANLTSEPIPSSTWTYDYARNVWTRWFPAVEPSPRLFASATYDTRDHVTLLFGGSPWSSPDPDGSIWTYDAANGTWKAMRPVGGPSSTSPASIAYDAGSDTVFLSGGLPAYYPGSHETWAYVLRANAWKRLAPPTSPPPRYGAVFASAPIPTLFGGNDGNCMMDLWTYAYSIGSPSEPRNVTASAVESSVALSWTPPADDGGGPVWYRIYRGTSPGMESLLTEIPSTSSFNDTNVSVGVTYVYRMSALNTLMEGPRSVEVRAMPSAPPGGTDWLVPAVATAAVVTVALAVAFVLLRRRRIGRPPDLSEGQHRQP